MVRNSGAYRGEHFPVAPFLDPFPHRYILVIDQGSLSPLPYQSYYF